MARSTTAGPSTPTIPLRVATENSTARLTKASMGSRQSNQASATSIRECPVESTVPLRLTSGCAPTSNAPAVRLDSASTASSATANVPTASSLPANRCRRVHERVRTVFHVPCRSSEANRSPASTPAISGRPQEPANPSTTSETAKPDECTQTPYSESAGLPLCTLSTPANANGPSTQMRARSRGASWLASLRRSTR